MASSHTNTRTSRDSGENRPQQPQESLLTPTALQVSLSPPRFPPYYSAQRSWLLRGKPAKEQDLFVVGVDDPTNEAHSAYHRIQPRGYELLVDKFLYGLRRQQKKKKNKNRHRHLRTDVLRHHPHWKPSDGVWSSIFHAHASPTMGPLQISDSVTRLLGTVLSLETQNSFRDTGGFQRVSDGLVQATIPLAAMLNPSALIAFGKLTHSQKRLEYGQDDKSVQFIDLFFPDQPSKPRGIVIFVHGGAWGSGKPWFYRLVALPFLKLSYVVAIVGYRVYPMADVHGQVEDVGLAFDTLCSEYPDLVQPTKGSSSSNRTILVGHSSGAHVALLWVAQRLKYKLQNAKNDYENCRMVDAFIGISGPYNVSHHYDYEGARGVEEISPLKAANGLTRDQLQNNSPANKFLSLISEMDESDQRQSFARHFPQSLFIHGIDDETVPYHSTSEICRILRLCGVGEKCYEEYVPMTAHQDAVVHLMLGGRVQNVVVEWLSSQPSGREDVSCGSGLLRSKL